MHCGRRKATKEKWGITLECCGRIILWKIQFNSKIGALECLKRNNIVILEKKVFGLSSLMPEQNVATGLGVIVALISIQGIHKKYIKWDESSRWSFGPNSA